MNLAISHDRQEETHEAKARWFQTLSVVEREDMLCYFTDVILEMNPKIAERKNAQPVTGRILVVPKA
jgi:hypothetical protein